MRPAFDRSRPAYREFLPAPPLRSRVLRLWTLCAPELSETQRRMRILPDGCMDLIFDLGGGLVPWDAPEGSPPPRAFLCGVMPEHGLVRLPASPLVVGVRLRPGAAFPLPATAGELAGGTVPLADLPPGLRSLEEALAESLHLVKKYSGSASPFRPAASVVMRAMAATLNRELADRLDLSPAAGDEPALFAAARLLEPTAPGDIPALARELGLSQRALERTFRRSVGLSPKRFARVGRLLRALPRLRTGQPLALVALDAGYYDQAHFTNEFKLLCGVSPSAFRRRPDTVEFLQDLADRPR